MEIAYISIANFRGISDAKIFFKGHSVIIGDNNAGKSTIVEAIDLVLGPDRLARTPVVDEHDFYNGKYYGEDAVVIEIEVAIISLSDEQISRFKGHLEFWDRAAEIILPGGNIEKTDDPNVIEALRVKFVGSYNEEEDDFEGETFFLSPIAETGNQPKFSKQDKRECGFLYLRALRTGARALSLERGSLLDIILRIKEMRPKMWEDVLSQLRNTTLQSDKSAGVESVLESLQESMKEFVPIDWGTQPHLKISDLTREHLRKTLTVFMTTGIDGYAAPFHHQGTGTINTMVLALLSLIAEAKNSVIFAMEEPETALPPYTQKRIVDSIRTKASQAIFTSHSPFVLEEFAPEQIILVQRNDRGEMLSRSMKFPAHIKPKTYNHEFRTRFTEALLAKRVLLTEGTTEALVYSAAARRLNELAARKFTSLEGLGVAIFNVGSENSVSIFGKYFDEMGKLTFAVFDKQTPAKLDIIQNSIKYPYECSYKGIEKLLVEETDYKTLKKFYRSLVTSWPSHLNHHKEAVETEDTPENTKKAVLSYLKWDKAGSTAVDLLGSCTSLNQIPVFIREVLAEIKSQLEPAVKEINSEDAL
ncbi:ATP-dependent nuclease [Niabella insulamsoli]|uniref:ATP-dependent nuclease n=1 Tax=Niabella insulamsoli TaxID=3144874 RepID=UPI0031FC7FF0